LVVATGPLANEFAGGTVAVLVAPPAAEALADGEALADAPSAD
jgi:hypothetical protein